MFDPRSLSLGRDSATTAAWVNLAQRRARTGRTPRFWARSDGAL